MNAKRLRSNRKSIKFGVKNNPYELEKLLQEYNVTGALEAITESEGRYLLKFKTVDSIRNRFAQERQAGSEQVLYSLLQRESADIDILGKKNLNQGDGY